MKLVIAEKPSVALEIAKVIGATKKENGYYAGGQYLVSWCVGHLIESAMPEDYNPDLKWSLESLPIIPQTWQTIVSTGTKAQYKVLESLIKSKEVTELICATDAGREGELIFRLVYEKTGSKKPFKRLWISSMEEKSILDGFASLKDGHEYDNLYEAAVCRMRADWLVGINASRFYTCMYNKKLNIGRVQSPTINIIVKRQRDIENFKAVPYFTMTADCGVLKAYIRADDKNAAERILDRCNNKNGYITKIEKQDKTENAMALYDLTNLQRDANRILGYSAQQTLDIVQSLYESKLCTYPRTDSRYLTEDMESSTYGLLNKIVETNLLNNQLSLNYDLKSVSIRRVINNKKVTDHHAIIPTINITNTKFYDLEENKRNILLLIIYRLLAAVYSPHKYTSTKVYIDIEGEEFSSTGKQITDVGFKAWHRYLTATIKVKAEEESKEEIALPIDLIEGQIFEYVKITAEAKKTQPPKPYTEDTLLSAMETAGKNIVDEELKEAMKDSGLGTPATRAGIIERIIKTGFIERKNKQLIATEQAFTLMDLLPDKLKEAELTAEWEKQLEEIHKGKLASATFIEGISDYIKELIVNYKETDTDNTFKKEKEVIGICPRCKSNVVEMAKSYSCEKEGCGFIIWKDDKFFAEKKKKLTKKQVAELLKKGKIKMVDLYSEKKNKKYDATVILSDTGKYVNFKLEFPKNTK